MPHKVVSHLRVLWRRRFGVLPLRVTLPALRGWFTSPLGDLILQRERILVDKALHNLFGYHLLQMSVSDKVDFTDSSRISHKFSVYPSLSEHPNVAALAEFNHLPLAAQAVDVVLLHHVLDYSQNPHQVLRESTRVLISHGHLLIVGFNPWSFFGIWRWIMRALSPAAQWRHQGLRLGRLLDWLAVLDLEPVMVQQGFYAPPLTQSRFTGFCQRLEAWGTTHGLPWGGVYCVLARKDTLAITPQKPQWQGYAGLRGWGVIKIIGRASRHPGSASNTRVSKDDGSA